MASLESPKYDIIQTAWMTDAQGNCIGAVAIEVHDGKWKAYIGVGSGMDESLDAHAIAALGAKMTKLAACGMFPYLEPEEWTS